MSALSLKHAELRRACGGPSAVRAWPAGRRARLPPLLLRRAAAAVATAAARSHAAALRAWASQRARGACTSGRVHPGVNRRHFCRVRGGAPPACAARRPAHWCAAARHATRVCADAAAARVATLPPRPPACRQHGRCRRGRAAAPALRFARLHALRARRGRGRTRGRRRPAGIWARARQRRHSAGPAVRHQAAGGGGAQAVRPGACVAARRGVCVRVELRTFFAAAGSARESALRALRQLRGHAPPHPLRILALRAHAPAAPRAAALAQLPCPFPPTDNPDARKRSPCLFLC
jgi:hypothetical protein